MPTDKYKPTKEDLAASPIAGGEADPIVGPEPELAPLSVAEMHALRQQIAELSRAQAAAEERNRTLESQLRENGRLIELLQGSQDVDLVALDAKWRNREEARRKLYAQVRGKKVTIMLIAGEDPNKNWPLHVNLNGVFHNIPRGVPYEIDGDFLEVMDHAEVRHIAPEVGPDGNPKWTLYDRLSYPYQIISGLDGCDQTDRLRAAA